MNNYARPTTLAELYATQTKGGAVQYLAGGQSLLAAMRLGMASPETLLDLQSVTDCPELYEIKTVNQGENKALRIGAMCTHDQIAKSVLTYPFSGVAMGIADQQVRNRGTIGGSLANNDPAACWPAAVLAANATIHVRRGVGSAAGIGERSEIGSIEQKIAIKADDFFTGFYSTALQAGDLITHIDFPKVEAFDYVKFEQAASRFALVGVAIAALKSENFTNKTVRVAITGLGNGVCRWAEAERALTRWFHPQALADLQFDEALAGTDLHASATYRAHLVGVLARRMMTQLDNPLELVEKTNEVRQHTFMWKLSLLRYRVLCAWDTFLTKNTLTRKSHIDKAVSQGLGGTEFLPLAPDAVWQNILDPVVLKNCIAGCEALSYAADNTIAAPKYDAAVKVGIGFVSARFAATVQLKNLVQNQSCELIFEGHAGAMGFGRGTAKLVLQPENRLNLGKTVAGTLLVWQVQIQAGGKLAAFGTRLIEATARSLSEDFFRRFSKHLLLAVK